MDPAATLARIARHDRGRLLSGLIARTGDVAGAEEALQEAFAAALTAWGAGIPTRPEGWLMRVALRRAIDAWRSGARSRAGAAAMVPLLPPEASEEEPDVIPDERLRLMFTCCHPALERKSQVALTLRLIGGLTTPEIAAAFLDDPATIGQRITRAKAKIAAAGIPYAVPGPDLWPDRLQSVLAVVYLIFNAGYSQGGTRDLCDEAIFLARLVDALRPAEAEAEGCLALMLVTHARQAARSAGGATVPPGRQDRTRWDMAMMAEGMTLIASAVARGMPGPFQIKALIATLHAAPGGADWPAILRLYDRLLDHEPTDVVRLNRAVALAESGRIGQAVEVTDGLSNRMQSYQPFHAAQAFILGLAGRRGESLAAYDRAIAMAPTSADALLLGRRRDEAAL